MTPDAARGLAQLAALLVHAGNALGVIAPDLLATPAPQTIEGKAAHLVEIAQAVTAEMGADTFCEMVDLAECYFDDPTLVVAVAALGAEPAVMADAGFNFLRVWIDAQAHPVAGPILRRLDGAGDAPDVGH